MITIPNTISASKARSNFYTLLDEVSNKLKRITVTHRGEVKVVLMHPDEVASWDETMEILADSKLVAQISESEKQRQKGKIVKEKKLFKDLKISPREIK